MSANRQARRWLMFYAVGAMGIVVQLATLAALTGGAGLDYLAGTFCAVEASVLHNFAWHERWTWSDRRSKSALEAAGRLLRFNFANGAISIIGNLVLMRLLAGALGINYLAANLVAIAACSILNFLAGDRFVFTAAGPLRRTVMLDKLRRFITAAMCILSALLILPRLQAADLRAETASAWTEYVGATEQRIARELASGKGFLSLDFCATAAAQRKDVLSGGIVISGMKTFRSSGEEIRVPYGMIHHWRGTVFIPGITLNDILSRVQNPARQDTKQEDVLASRVLERGPDSLRLYLKLQRSKFVTVAYNTEHVIRYLRHSDGRVSSSSVATKIAELENPNTAAEKEKPQGHDRGFLWRLNSYWRYEQAGTGVLVECESISLSRSIPAPLEFFVRPLINKVAKESMHRTLASMRARIEAGIRG